jgi:hypothetical protein
MTAKYLGNAEDDSSKSTPVIVVVTAPPNQSCPVATCGQPPLLPNGSATGKATVQKTPIVYLIFWGPDYAAADGERSLITSAEVNVFAHMKGSAYQAILSQYGVSEMTYGGSWTDAAKPPSSISASAFGKAAAAEIDKAVSKNKNWVVGADTQFIVFPDQGTYITFPKDQPDLCAFHSWYPAASPTHIFSVIPYTGDDEWRTEGCQSNYGGGNQTLAMTTLATHEYAEAATDPTGKGYRVIAPSSPYTEIGDYCAYQGQLVAPFAPDAVQYLWSNKANGCVIAG